MELRLTYYSLDLLLLQIRCESSDAARHGFVRHRLEFAELGFGAGRLAASQVALAQSGTADFAGASHAKAFTGCFVGFDLWHFLFPSSQ
jgi:hypothetical protein